MLTKIKHIGNFFFYALFTNTIYGAILFLGFTWIASFSQVIAYLFNLAMIIIGLAIDTSTKELVQTQKLAKQLKNEKEIEQARGLINWISTYFVSFKTILYIFYALILVISPIIDLSPAHFSDSLASFIQSNSYSILFVITFDMISTQISKDSKDREKMKESWQKLKGSPSEKSE